MQVIIRDEGREDKVWNGGAERVVSLLQPDFGILSARVTHSAPLGTEAMEASVEITCQMTPLQKLVLANRLRADALAAVGQSQVLSLLLDAILEEDADRPVTATRAKPSPEALKKFTETLRSRLAKEE